MQASRSVWRSVAVVEPSLRNLVNGAAVQFRIMHGLMVRDMMLRFGRDNIGFLWIIVEPMILTGLVLFMYAQIKAGYMQRTHVISMVLTGYMPLTMWRHTSGVGGFLLRRSANVLYHRHITLLDAFLARMLLEGIATTAALAMVYSILWSAGIVGTIAKPGHLLAAWLLLWWLGTAVALILAVFTETHEASERFIQPLQYMVVPISGVFFMVDWMPYRLQQWLVYNPLTNCIESFRDGFLGNEVTTHYYPSYVVMCTVVLTWLGLVMLSRSKNSLSLTT
jgi:capsular polysaccharide transport system permease protein